MQISEDERNFIRYGKSGDSRAFERLYLKYRERLYGYFFNCCTDHDVANEMFQEVWLKVIRSAESYQSQGKFRQWLFSCAHNIVVDYYRRQAPQSEQQPEKLTSQSCDEQLEIGERINMAIASLPFEQRQAFHLRQQLGCSIDEVAILQDCSKEAAKSRVRYAFAKLRESLEDLV